MSALALAGGPVPGPHTEAIAELSGALRKLGAYPAERQGERYRNPNGVVMKLMSLRAIEAEGAHGLSRTSQMDAAVWREFADDLPRLREEAAAIRARLQEGALLPPKAAPVVEDVDIEQQNTETYMVSPSGEPRATDASIAACHCAAARPGCCTSCSSSACVSAPAAARSWAGGGQPRGADLSQPGRSEWRGCAEVR
jgi:hypothetical protein